MKSSRYALAWALCLAFTLAGPAAAQARAPEPAASAAALADVTADMTAGEVRKVDQDARKLTIKHGEIRNLDMPPMTMVFQVKDGALLDGLKAGDKIRFVVEKAASGYGVTEIRPVP